MRPSVVMSAGMMPALDLPGEATPGQFGPMMRVWLPASDASAQSRGVSCTGTPSVISRHSGMRSSMASITASFVYAAGTNTTETSAPVAAIVSATVPNTGTSVPFKATVCPALRGFVPPTTLAPAASILAPCLVPSDPVMPWIMIRLWPVRKIAISCPLRGQFGGACRRAVHRVDPFHHGDAGLVQDPPALDRVVAVQPDNYRPDHHRITARTAVGEHADRGHDPVGHRVAGGDPAEDVHEHGLDRGIGPHDLQAVGHHLGGRAATDVEEVSRPHAAELLARVGHHVERGHDQAGAVADDADLALELDVVEVLLPGPRLDRIGVLHIGEPRVLLTERGVVVEGHLAIYREHLTVLGEG